MLSEFFTSSSANQDIAASILNSRAFAFSQCRHPKITKSVFIVYQISNYFFLSSIQMTKIGTILRGFSQFGIFYFYGKREREQSIAISLVDRHFNIYTAEVNCEPTGAYFCFICGECNYSGFQFVLLAYSLLDQ